MDLAQALGLRRGGQRKRLAARRAATNAISSTAQPLDASPPLKQRLSSGGALLDMPSFVSAVLYGPLNLQALPGSGAAQAPLVARLLCTAGLRAIDQSGPPGVAIFTDSPTTEALAAMAPEVALVWLVSGLADPDSAAGFAPMPGGDPFLCPAQALDGARRSANRTPSSLGSDPGGESSLTRTHLSARQASAAGRQPAGRAGPARQACRSSRAGWARPGAGMPGQLLPLGQVC